MKMFPYILFFLFACSACGLLGSKDKPLEPGPRNYEWRVDSVYSTPGGWMNTIWGSSPDDVWMGSNEGKIFHFDGQEWKLFQTYEKEGNYISRISDIQGSSPSDIYAVGIAIENETSAYRGFLLHYDGSQWKELLVSDFDVQFQRLCEGKEGVIIRGSNRVDGSPRTLSFFKYSNHEFKETLSKTTEEVETLWMNCVGNEIYYVVGNDIQKQSNGKFKTIISIASEETPIGINGRHQKDLFIVTENGVTHYNGENLYSLFSLNSENASVFRELVFEKDIFFLVNDYDAGTNLIYHGTLTKTNGRNNA